MPSNPTTSRQRPPAYSDRQIDLLNYLADLEDDYDSRDYASPRYRGEGSAIRRADHAFMAKVASAINADSYGPLWGTRAVAA